MPASSRACESFSGVWPPSCTMMPHGSVRLFLANQFDDVLGSHGSARADPRCRNRSRRFPDCTDHDGLISGLGKCVSGMDAAAIEFDALADPVRLVAKDHDFFRIGWVRLHSAAQSRRPHSRNTYTAWARESLRTYRSACRLDGYPVRAGPLSRQPLPCLSAHRRASEKPICFSWRNLSMRRQVDFTKSASTAPSIWRRNQGRSDYSLNLWSERPARNAEPRAIIDPAFAR